MLVRLFVRPQIKERHLKGPKEARSFCKLHLFKRLYPRVPQVIAADGEQKAARALKQASETISESSSAMQLRYLQASDKLSLDTLELLNFDMNSFSES